MGSRPDSGKRLAERTGKRFGIVDSPGETTTAGGTRGDSLATRNKRELPRTTARLRVRRARGRHRRWRELAKRLDLPRSGGDAPSDSCCTAASSGFPPRARGCTGVLSVAVPHQLCAGRVALASEPAEAPDQTDSVAEARRRRQLAGEGGEHAQLAIGEQQVGGASAGQAVGPAPQRRGCAVRLLLHGRFERVPPAGAGMHRRRPGRP